MKANDIKPGNVLEHKGRLWLVYKTEHTKPGKGGAFIQCEMKDVRDGTKLNERFRSVENVSKARLDELEHQFLFADGDILTFMDNETFEQVTVPETLMDETQRPYLTEGMTVRILSHESEVIGVTLPETVVLEVAETEPVVKGQTAASSYKPAMMNNGVRIMVPPFVCEGDRVVVNTGDNSYVERAKDAS